MGRQNERGSLLLETVLAIYIMTAAGLSVIAPLQRATVVAFKAREQQRPLREARQHTKRNLTTILLYKRKDTYYTALYGKVHAFVPQTLLRPCSYPPSSGWKCPA